MSAGMVFEDLYAEYFFPDDIRRMFSDPAMVGAELAKFEEMMPGVNGAIVARIRFIDQCLADAVRDGFTQAAIIGAGFDTRAYRIDGVETALTVFEVDHPATQAVKIETVTALFGGLPAHVVHVPVVFGEDAFADKILACGYRTEARTLFILEGLLMYLPPQAVDGLLAFVAGASGPASMLVADVFDTSVVAGTSLLKEANMLRRFVEREGSSLKFGIPQGEEAAFFKARGFRRVTCTSAASCKARFFTNDSCNRTVSPMFRFVQAMV